MGQGELIAEFGGGFLTARTPSGAFAFRVDIFWCESYDEAKRKFFAEMPAAYKNYRVRFV